MGAIAEAFTAYAQPLLDQSDGSMEQMNKAFALTQFCFNLALMPEGDRDSAISRLRSSLGIDDDEFEDMRRNLIMPMVRRHEAMFPQMHRMGSTDQSQSGTWPRGPSKPAQRPEMEPITDRYAPCPCNSGRKYKFCCGAKGR